jgi:hypothetical protein
MDKGVSYEYLGEETLNNTPYEIVKVSFNFGDSNPTDIYQLYINKNTFLVDQFLFTVAEYGVLDTPYLMKLEYEKVDGILIPNKRHYRKSNWNADETEEPYTQVSWTNIRFNNGFKKSKFKKQVADN